MGTKFLEFDDLLGSMEKALVNILAEPLGSCTRDSPQLIAALLRDT